jgi:hypothetical protein
MEAEDVGRIDYEDGREEELCLLVVISSVWKLRCNPLDRNDLYRSGAAAHQFRGSAVTPGSRRRGRAHGRRVGGTRFAYRETVTCRTSCPTLHAGT